MFFKLLSHIQVFPNFLEVVYSFGEKVGPKDEGYHGYSDLTWSSPNKVHGRRSKLPG